MSALFFRQLFDGHRWLRRARVEIDSQGDVVAVQDDSSEKGCKHVDGCAIPGIPNLHSHAHQRAMAGLTERTGTGDDSFWTWRSRMYRHLRKLTPEQLEAIAAQLYVEMLEAGYTAVGEFQYLHHDPDGEPYEEPAEMTLRCLAAASETGIGITCLPVFYAQGGFDGRDPEPGQRRFLHEPDAFLRLVERLEAETKRSSRRADIAVGIAPHSLRAVSPGQLDELLAGFGGRRGPIHIHVAETRKEVEDCVAWSGHRPVRWLLDHAPVDERWCLIHVTHMTRSEVRDLATCGAVAGLCPTTEANLGDGIPRTPELLASGGHVGIGSDSHISVDPAEELRWLEYVQRLTRHQRNILAGGPGRSTARHLLAAVLTGGARACGRKIGALAPGRRADIVVLDLEHPTLIGREGDEILDSWIFSGRGGRVKDVWVGGRQVIHGGLHPRREAILGRYRQALHELKRTVA